MPPYTPILNARGLLVPRREGEELDDMVNWQAIDQMIEGTHDKQRLLTAGPNGVMTTAQLARLTALLGSNLNQVLRFDTHPWNHTGLTTADVDIVPPLTIPGGTLKANSVLSLEAVFEYSANTNSKKFSVYIGGVRWGAGADIDRTSATANVDIRQYRMANQDAVNVNKDLYYGAVGPNTALNAALPVRAIDFAVDQTVRIVGTLANAADFIRIPFHRIIVENI